MHELQRIFQDLFQDEREVQSIDTRVMGIQNTIEKVDTWVSFLEESVEREQISAEVVEMIEFFNSKKQELYNNLLAIKKPASC